MISQAILSFWTILSGRNNPRHFEYHNAQNKLFGSKIGKDFVKKLHNYRDEDTRSLQIYLAGKRRSVDVFIPVYGEPVEEIKETAIAARDMYGLHTTYILDDGDSNKVKAMAKKIGVSYIRRPEHTHAKAGNINYALSVTTGDFFVILDADFVAKKDFLYETLPFFEDENKAMVAVFQWGWLGLTDAPGPLVSFLPIISIGILLGLAMDYEFFLVSGMHEAYGRDKDAKKAAVQGFAVGSKVVTVAAIIMISVFGGFITNHDSTIQTMGFGLAVGILVDAFIVRMTIVPAVMVLLGKAAWWLPQWLDRRLPHISIEGDEH